MKRLTSFVLLALGTTLFAVPAQAEILAMMNYESKTEESLKALKIGGSQERREGIAILDVDPASERFGEILMDIPLPSDLVSHHLFYDRTMTKAYMTALGKGILHVFDMQQFPYRLKPIETPGCEVQEDVIFSEDNKTWYVTCMGTANVVVGDTATDTIRTVIDLPMPYPHGFAVHSGIDRALVTSTVRASDLGDAGETVTVIEASTNTPLSSLKMSNKPSPAAEAPVEILFAPGSNPPVALVTNMYGGSLWAAVWDADNKEFSVHEAYNFEPVGAGVPLEIYFNDAVDRLYVTTAKPGHLHIFDVSEDPSRPKLLKSIPAAEGAHHVAITKDERYGFVQNALLNLPGMSDGSITVVDLEKGEAVASVDTLKNMGLNPNSIVLLPEWNSLAGH
ncbi:MAG: YncE family protein [Gammaproteobacteria bacterium]|nr:YncE family protein [Gammaproteobacteria bacterium]